jgi:hypothetical protein
MLRKRYKMHHCIIEKDGTVVDFYSTNDFSVVDAARIYDDYINETIKYLKYIYNGRTKRNHTRKNLQYNMDKSYYSNLLENIFWHTNNFKFTLIYSERFIPRNLDKELFSRIINFVKNIVQTLYKNKIDKFIEIRPYYYDNTDKWHIVTVFYIDVEYDNWKVNKITFEIDEDRDLDELINFIRMHSI